jgi:two-component system, NarL family, response regulator NreC
MKLRILLVDDHTIVRDGLRALLSTEKDFCVAGEAADGPEAIKLAEQLHPDVVVMDIGIPGISGIEATRKILTANPEIKVVALSIHTDRRFVSGMLGVGARGYLPKNCAAEELIRAVREVYAGHVYISANLKDVVMEDYAIHAQGKGQDTLASLSGREREGLCMLASGQNVKQIAASLGLSPKTVEAHRQHIMEKLDLHSVADLTRFAVREGLVSSDT